LKAIRDGIQDYEYAQILKNLGQISLRELRPAADRHELDQLESHPNALEGARLQLGQMLHQLSPP